MRRRIFIAINLPGNIRKKLADFQQKCKELPARWTKLNNIHITLSFIGYASDEEFFEVSKITKEVASKHSSFSVRLSKICYGPPQLRSGQAPKMVWAVGEKSKDFALLRDDLEDTLASSEKVRFSPEKREFCPHITLARIGQWAWQRIEPEERPEIQEDINFEFSVDSIEIMESELKRGGAEYTVLESHQLR